MTKQIRGLKFPVGGRVEPVALDSGDNLEDMYREIGCRYVEHYALVFEPERGDDVVGLWFDEEYMLVNTEPAWNRAWRAAAPRRGEHLPLAGNVLAFSSFEGETTSLSLRGAELAIELCVGVAIPPYLPEGDLRTRDEVAVDMRWAPTGEQLREWLEEGKRW